MKVRNLVILFLASCLIAGGAILFTREAPKTPEEAIDQVLDEMAQAARDKDLGGILEHVSERFRGEGQTRDQLKGMLFIQLRQAGWAGVWLTERQITLQSPALADVQTKALLARGSSLLPSNADAYDLTLGFALEDTDAWRVVRARWQR